MTFSITRSSIIIDDNIIDYGTATPDQVIESTYSYSTVLETSADARISNNRFGGIASNSSSGVMMQLTNHNSCNVSGNYFLRDNSSLQAYINANSDINSKDHIVTDNVFDFMTTDGYNKSLFINYTRSSTYIRNKNQTNSTLVPIGDNNFIFIATDPFASTQISPLLNNSPFGSMGSYSEYAHQGSAGAITGNPNGLYVSPNYNNSVTFYSYSSSGTQTHNFQNSWNISNLVPNNVRITKIKMGAFIHVANITGFTVTVSLGRILPNDNATNAAAMFSVSSDLDGTAGPTNFVSGDIIATTGPEITAIKTSTQYATIDLTNYLSNGDISGNFISNQLNALELNIFGTINLFSSTTNTIIMSGIMIEYVW